MPNCFQLFRKGEKTALALSQVDREICERFGAIVHDRYYYHEWYGYIGLRIALGKTLEQIRETIREDRNKENTADGNAYWDRMEEIRAFMEQNYTSDAWAERGRR